MKTQHFDIFIQAPPKQVWARMLQIKTLCEGEAPCDS